ncbi:MAG: STAS domain-containing protein [Oscillochloridaceae bacterium]|nr:STAS domain-containing protein [Chloroflexaceae bacterium]MDW8388892.1 STAS domain-containing protein [Oscillochloridaceae bacterium]
MQRLGSWIIRVNTSNEDRQRRGQTLIILGIGLIALALAAIPLSMIAGQPSALFISASALVLLVGVIILARMGRVNLGAYLLLFVLLAGIIGSFVARPVTPNGLFFMILPILCASILLPPIHIWSTLVLAMAGVLLSFGLLPANLRDDRYWRVAALSAPLLMAMSALVSFLGARMVKRSLTMAHAARAEADAANQALAASNVSLEARVAERTAALQQLADEQTALAAQLQASLETQKDLNRVIAALSMPVIPISDRVLVAPIIGNLDTERTQLLLATVLDEVEAARARVVVLDITGVAVVDTQVAAALLRVAGAVRLMGAETLLVGIRPEVAQALASLGVNLGELRTAATLQDGLRAIGFSDSARIAEKDRSNGRRPS